LSNFIQNTRKGGGRDSVFGIVTGYKLDRPGFHPPLGKLFPTRQNFSETSLGPIQPPEMGTEFVFGSKEAGAWCWPPTPIQSRC